MYFGVYYLMFFFIVIVHKFLQVQHVHIANIVVKVHKKHATETRFSERGCQNPFYLLNQVYSLNGVWIKSII